MSNSRFSAEFSWACIALVPPGEVQPRRTCVFGVGFTEFENTNIELCLRNRTNKQTGRGGNTGAVERVPTPNCDALELWLCLSTVKGAKCMCSAIPRVSGIRTPLKKSISIVFHCDVMNDSKMRSDELTKKKKLDGGFQ